MSNDLNLCQFIGRAGRDPETRYTASGDAVTSFTLAVGWKSKDKEGTEWVRCVTFSKLAEIAGEYIKKGKQVYVSGRFKTRDYEKDGVKHYVTEVNVDQLKLLGGRDAEPAPSSTPAPRQAQRPAPAPKSSTGFDDMDDDIPF
jgi:single-strand DNA-binding protein